MKVGSALMAVTVGVALSVMTAVFSGACSKTTNGGGLEVLVGTNLRTPQDFDSMLVQISQQTTNGQSTSFLNNTYDIPAEAKLPTSFSIAAGTSPDQVAIIKIVALRGGTPVDVREAQVQVPTDRVASLTLILSESCLGQVTTLNSEAVPTCPAGESCQPETGTCGPTLVMAKLPTYTDASLAEIDASVGDFRHEDATTGKGDATQRGDAAKKHDAAQQVDARDEDAGEEDGSEPEEASGFPDGFLFGDSFTTCSTPLVNRFAMGEPSPSDVGLDDSFVYWVDSHSGSSLGSIVKAAKASLSTRIPIAQSLQNPVRLAIDDGYVYWVESPGSGEVFKVPLAGGQITTLAQGASATDLALDGRGNVYWVADVDGYVFRVATTGGSKVTVASGQSDPTSVAVDSTRVYWTNNGADGGVMSAPLDGGPPVKFAAAANPNSVRVGDAGVFWLETIGNETAIVRASTDGGGPTTLVKESSIVRFSLGQASIDYTTGDAGYVVHLPLGGGSPSTLGCAAVNPVGISSDSTGVYWTEDVDAGTVNVASPEGGSPP